MPETRFTEFPVLSVRFRHYPLTRGLGFLGLIGDPCWITFLTYDTKNDYSLFVISLIFDIIRRITTFSERYSVFFVLEQN